MVNFNIFFGLFRNNNYHNHDIIFIRCKYILLAYTAQQNNKNTKSRRMDDINKMYLKTKNPFL